jgi:hypothetical protein
MDRMARHHIGDGPVEQRHIFIQHHEDLLDVHPGPGRTQRMKQHAVLQRRQLIAINHVTHAS